MLLQKQYPVFYSTNKIPGFFNQEIITGVLHFENLLCALPQRVPHGISVYVAVHNSELSREFHLYHDVCKFLFHDI